VTGLLLWLGSLPVLLLLAWAVAPPAAADDEAGKPW
jgi:hypothetical protein